MLEKPGAEIEFCFCLKVGASVLNSFNKLLCFYQQKFDLKQTTLARTNKTF